MRTLRHASAAAVAVGMLVLPASVAGALQTPTTGQPGANGGVTCQTQPSSPGQAAFARGSVFNASGIAGNHYAGNLDTESSEHAKSTAAVSEYDVACLRVSTH